MWPSFLETEVAAQVSHTLEVLMWSFKEAPKMVVQGRRETSDLGQDGPVILVGNAGGSSWELIYHWIQNAYSRHATCFWLLCADAQPCRVLQWESIHQLYPSAGCSWYHGVGKVILLGQDSVEEDWRKLDQSVLSCLIEGGPLKTIQLLCYISIERPRLIKRHLSKILYKGFINH